MHVSYFNQPSALVRRGPTLLLTLVMVLGLAALLAAPPLAVPTDFSGAVNNLDFQLPLSFVPNAGQADSTVHFQVHDGGSTIFFKSTEAVLALPAMARNDASVVNLRFEGANPEPTVTGVDRLPGVVNYFLGNDPASWHTNLPTYAGVVYHDLYPGIDLRYDGGSGQLKGTYTVAPGADPFAIRWRHAGANDVRLDAATGNLIITLPDANGRVLTEQAPVAWQEVNGGRVFVDSRYVLAADGSVGFALGSYNPALPLTIDPTLSYSTYLGGSGFEELEGLAVDGDGNIYVASTVFALPWGQEDVLVTKINATGDAVIYSSYFGGGEDDSVGGLAVDDTGHAYVAGDTDSTDLPTSVGALQSSYSGLDDAFAVKFNQDGDALVYSTYLGGSNIDSAEGIAVDSAGSAYLVGTTFSSGLFSGSYEGHGDAFAAKLAVDGSALVYGIYLGGGSFDSASDVAVDSSGYAYVTGETFSSDFATANPLQATHGGESDVFVAKLDTDASSLLFSTYLGGDREDYSYGIALDTAGNAYVTGDTDSPDFPTTVGAFDTTCGTDGNCNYQEAYPGYGYSHSDAFVAKLETDGSALAYSTYLGGGQLDKGADVTVDAAGNAYVTGETFSADYPTLGSLQNYVSPEGNTAMAFVTRLEADGAALVYSTFLGGSSSDYGTGIVADADGNAFVAGITFSQDFPTVDPLQASHGGGDADGFVAKISSDPSPPPASGPNLHGSYKAASQYQLVSGETLSYTIHLYNIGTEAATADVTDVVPEEVMYVDGSVTGGGAYNPDTMTLSWNDLTVAAGEDLALSFAVTGTEVASPTLVTNMAAISTTGEVLERYAVVLLTPESVPPIPPIHNLHGSRKLASQYYLAPEEIMTYTIRLHNSGTISATADVTDPVPVELEYVDGSVTGGGVYDAGTLTWDDIVVPAGESVLLTFQVKPVGTVSVPAVVINTATIAVEDESFQRAVGIVLVPEPVDEDGVPPELHSLTIDEQDVLTDPQVTLHISATDDVEVRWMYLREWQLATTPWPHWEVAQSSGWVPYEAEYDWTLGSQSGVHFVGAWVADGGGNLSPLARAGLDYASLLLADEMIDKGGLVPYLVHYEAGVTVDATLTPSSGDADLYVWYPGSHLMPDEKSTLPGTATDSVSFVTPEAGTYLFLVHGYTAATFDLSITPVGGPRAWDVSNAPASTTGQSLSAMAISGKADELITEPILSQSGLDPLYTADAPSAPSVIYLPAISW